MGSWGGATVATGQGMPVYVYGVEVGIVGRGVRVIVGRGARGDADCGACAVVDCGGRLVVDITTRRSLAFDNAPLGTHRFTVPTGIDVGSVARAISAIVVQSMKMITPKQSTVNLYTPPLTHPY